MSLSQQEIDDLKDYATKLRIHSVESTTAAGSGHPTSCASMAELMSVLFFKVMKYTLEEPRAEYNDRFILSKGHAAPILYAAWAEAGLFPITDLMNLRKLNSDLEGHPTPRLNFVDVATGSLGQGLSVACGMAYCGKYFDKASYRTYCLLGDGESMEGNIWEALNFASYYKLDNLVSLIDVNRLGQSDPTSLGHDMKCYKERLDSFGFHSIIVDGHDVSEIYKALREAERIKGRPTCILAKTFKGNDFPSISDNEDWHGKALGDKSIIVVNHLKSLLKNPNLSTPLIEAPNKDATKVNISNIVLSEAPSYSKGESLATRQAYGNALVKIAMNNPRVIALDGDMKNSTFSLNLRKAFPERHIECFICEQNLVGTGIGLACRDRCIVFISTFACFLTRAFDNFRMGVISQSNINVVGSHCGVSIGEDGPSQMALEDLAMFRSLPGSTVFYPSDAVSTERAVEIAANTKGITFIRVSRPATNVLYENNEVFEIGKAKIVFESKNDKVLIIAAGITLSEALKAGAQCSVGVRIMDPFTIKPLDKDAIIAHALECGGRILSVEDHYSEGGIGDAVLDAVALRRDIIVKKLCVRELPRSGPPMDLLNKYGIDSEAILSGINDILKI